MRLLFFLALAAVAVGCAQHQSIRTIRRNYFLLRLREPDQGAICFWDHELEDFRPPAFESLIRVSDSFPLWLISLREP
jgi:hypothetical protein